MMALLLVAVRHWLDPVIDVAVAPYLFGILGVVAAAWFGGLGPGLVTSFAFAFLIVALHVAPTSGGWGQLALPQWLRASAFIVQSVVISIIIDRLVQARRYGLLHSTHQQLRMDVRRRISEAHSEEQAMIGVLGVLLDRLGGTYGHAWSFDQNQPRVVVSATERRADAKQSAGSGSDDIGRLPGAEPSKTGLLAMEGGRLAVGSDTRSEPHGAHVLAIPLTVQSEQGVRRGLLLELRGSEPFASDARSLRGLAEIAVETGECLSKRTIERTIQDLRERLAERAQELQAVLDTAPIGIAVSFDERCRILTVNAAGSAIVGVPPSARLDGIAGMVSEEVLPTPLREPMRETMATGRPIGPVEFEIVRPDGTRRCVYQYASALLDASGRPRGSVAAFVDVSVLRDAERSARDREQAFRRSFECAGVGKAQIEPTTGRFTLVNRRLCEMLGVAAPELEGNIFSETLEPIERSRAASILQSLVDGTEGAVTVEFQFRHADGGAVFGATSLTAACDSSGRTTHLIAVIQDITDRKRAEGELERYRNRLEELVAARTLALEESHTQLRLSERMAALGTLCAGLGHDMGNLLLPVRLRLEAMVIKGVPPNVEEDVRAIGKSAEYLQRLANGLRLLSLDPERPAAFEATDLTEWWSDVHSFLKNCLPRGAELERHIAADVPIVAVSRHRLTQAIFNLVQNAGDALKDRRGGWVRIAAERSPDGRGVRIMVSDNGAGMAPEVRARCMEPFFTSKARGISTGLGLSLVHGIVQQCGGTIEIDSVPGKGTSFLLTLPEAAPPPAKSEPAAHRPPIRAVVSLADGRLRAYATTVARALGCEVDEVIHESLPELVLGGEVRGVVWVTDAAILTIEQAEHFAQSGRPQSRRILAFGRLPDDRDVQNGVQLHEVQWVEQVAPSMIRRTLRTTVSALAEELDRPSNEPDDERQAARQIVAG
ncbi:MAG: PAS domain S-box protein [Phycisphaerae bacterium]|nr:PAS domain S-box protein [Phycisphaerae bacterium]